MSGGHCGSGTNVQRTCQVSLEPDSHRDGGLGVVKEGSPIKTTFFHCIAIYHENPGVRRIACDQFHIVAELTPHNTANTTQHSTPPICMLSTQKLDGGPQSSRK
jgi:hypothetical protein